MEKYTRKSIFDHLKLYDQFADEDDYIEVTEWRNGEGFDVDMNGKQPTKFSLTWGEYEALRKLVKKLYKDE